eukprot:2564893-Amphidinium_carterae.1
MSTRCVRGLMRPATVHKRVNASSMRPMWCCIRWPWVIVGPLGWRQRWAELSGYACWCEQRLSLIHI